MYNKKPLYGFGVNDSDYVVQPSVNGTRKICPFYRTWQDMLKRTCSEKYKIKNPTYHGSSVCPDWLVFSVFRAWMVDQDWKGKQLDKDILIEGNKCYSPETCVFVDARTNSFMSTSGKSTNTGLPGVSLRKNGVYAVQCDGKTVGNFRCINEAKNAYITQKALVAKELASQQSDERVKYAIIERFVKEI